METQKNYDLLTAAEEISLATLIQAGIIAKNNLRTPKRNAVIKKGEEANIRFIEANLRLVQYVARKYIGHGLELEDLVQEGNLGLMHAITKFDPTRGFRFSTYALPWIRQYLTRALGNQSRTVRIPLYQVESINKLRGIHNALIAEHHSEPTIAELALVSGFSESKVRELNDLTRPLVSLDAPLSEDGNGTRGDFIADPLNRDPGEIVDARAIEENLSTLIEGLGGREAEILKMRFGFSDSEPLSLSQIGHRLDLPRERVRQIEGEALSKLRHPARSSNLLPLLV
jgi:RNA polymerase primary sigma factor